MSEKIDPARLADSYISRLADITTSRDYEVLDSSLEGYLLIPDADEHALYLVLSSNNFLARKNRYGHDLGVVAFDVIEKSDEPYTAPNGWVPAEIPKNMKLKALGVEYGDKRSTFIVKLEQNDQSATPSMVGDDISHAFETVTVTSGMLEEHNPSSLTLDETDSQMLHLEGYTVKIIQVQGRPAVIVGIDGKRMLVDSILFSTNPQSILQGYIAEKFPGQTDWDKPNPGIPFEDFPVTFTSSDISAFSVGPQDNPDNIILTYPFWLVPDTRHPIRTLTQYRSYMISLIQNGATVLHQLRGRTEQEIYEGLNRLTMKRLLDIQEQVMALPKNDRTRQAHRLLTQP